MKREVNSGVVDGKVGKGRGKVVFDFYLKMGDDVLKGVRKVLFVRGERSVIFRK